MVQNNLFLTCFRVVTAMNFDVIWMPLRWLMEDLLIWSKSFSFWMQKMGGLNNMEPLWGLF